MKPLVSILMPCYNVETWLLQSVESALSQTWENIEIIIVNDGSTDGTLELAKSLNSPKIKVISQENKGQSAAENRAFLESQGDFIEYLDADDLLSPEKIEKQIQLLDREGSEFISACEWARFYKSPNEAKFIPESVWADMSPVDWLIASWNGGGMMHGASWLIPRKVSERAGLWNESLSLINDFDYFSRVLLASKGVKFCWGAKSYYRSGNPNSLSGSKSNASIKSAFQSFEIGTSNLLANENSPRTRKVCANVVQRFIYEFYPDSHDLLIKAEAKVIELGGSDVKPVGSPLFMFMSNLMGWKLTKRFQNMKRNVIERI